VLIDEEKYLEVKPPYLYTRI